MKKEIENWDEVRFDIRGEDLWAHAKNPAHVLLVDAFGLEEGDYVFNGLQRG